MTNTLLDFLRTGKLGDICIGMTRDAVRQTFGKPDATAISNDIWLYGNQGNNNIQIPFVDNRVHGIWLYFSDSTEINSIPQSLRANLWTINGETGVAELTNQLAVHKIKWRIHAPLTFDDQTCVLTQSDVHCIWTHDGETRLQKINLTSGCDKW